jgi:hypothetical protein
MISAEGKIKISNKKYPIFGKNKKTIALAVVKALVPTKTVFQEQCPFCQRI